MEERRIARRATTLLIALSGFLFVPTASFHKQSQNPTTDYSSTPFRLETAKWSEPYSGPLGYPKGAQRASLGVDPRTGGETYYARFPAGSRFALHSHSNT